MRWWTLALAACAPNAVVGDWTVDTIEVGDATAPTAFAEALGETWSATLAVPVSLSGTLSLVIDGERDDLPVDVTGGGDRAHLAAAGLEMGVEMDCAVSSGTLDCHDDGSTDWSGESADFPFQTLTATRDAD